MDELAWAKRPKWHRFETPRSYAKRQCESAGIPFDFAERGLTSASQPYINRVWVDEAAAAAIVEATAGRPSGHYERLLKLAQPDPALSYQERFLCRLCAAGDRVEQIPHDRENWCMRHAGQMVWVGPGTTPDSQIVVSFDMDQVKAERAFRRMASSGRINVRLHTRVWEMVRDNAWLTRASGWTQALAPHPEDRETRGRASLYPEIVAVLAILSNPETVERWRTLAPADLRADIARTLLPAQGPVDVLVERIVLWLRPLRRETRPTRFEPLDVPRDIVDTPAIIDSTSHYPLWIQRHPQAIAEWDWGRNDPSRNPWDPMVVSRKAWWLCDQGHSWEASPAVRAQSGCPYCAGQYVWPGHNDLGTRYPSVAAEWDDTPGANPGDPDHVGAQSTRHVNWTCGKGHRWVASINNRTRHGSGCPYCAGYRASPGETDLATLRPDLAAEWDVERNSTLLPHVVGLGSNKKVWWRGSCGHRWQAVVSKRSAGRGCPYCIGRRVIPGETDLATVRPDLAKEWDASNDFAPSQLFPKSGRKVTWRCVKGHTWEASAHKRSNGRGCPYCAGTRRIPGETDLAAVRPDLAKEWDASNDLLPEQVAPFSNRKVAWRCASGHSWETTVASRSSGSGCPVCSPRRGGSRGAQPPSAGGEITQVAD